MLPSRTNVVVTLVEYARFHKKILSFIISLCLNVITPPPQSMLFEVKEDLRVFNTTLILGRGVGVHKGYFIEVSQQFYPSL